MVLLISTKHRKVHMKLGWSVLAIAPTIAVTGPLVAYRSIRLVPSQTIFEWPGPQFLLVMFAEMALFVVFVSIGVLNRKRPRIHRPMMLMASLSLLSGATARIPQVVSIFGPHQWVGLFGPVTALGALLLLARWAITRSFEREAAVGFAVFVAATLLVSRLALTDTWILWAGMILKR